MSQLGRLGWTSSLLWKDKVGMCWLIRGLNFCPVVSLPAPQQQRIFWVPLYVWMASPWMAFPAPVRKCSREIWGLINTRVLYLRAFACAASFPMYGCCHYAPFYR